MLACLCVIAILISMSMLGKAEYDKNYCAARLELKANERPALMKNRAMLEIVSPKGKKYSSAYGCCRVPDGAKGISLQEYCINAPDYQIPDLSERIRQILKKFK